MTLLAWKLHDDKCMYLTRGNHEETSNFIFFIANFGMFLFIFEISQKTKSMNELYGFEGEVRHKGIFLN